ncbi:MAG: superoxide dismutase family protein [Hyphomonadaceae bacterium]|nr:superoxide dismutase family protein [Hyphomonadaceae bacterium]
MPPRFTLPISFAATALALAACGPNTPAPTVPAPDMTDQSVVAMSRATPEGAGDAIGTVTIRDSAQGAIFDLNLYGLPPGPHGFHVHETADCGPMAHDGEVTPAGAAGGHWDPEDTGHHAGPTGDGHLGDLPRIDVGDDGRAVLMLTAPRISDIDRLRGHALMIHEGGDTYTDTPELGGGGARIACGVIG